MVGWKLQWIEPRGPSVGKTQSANNCLTAQLAVLVTTEVQCRWDSGQEIGSSHFPNDEVGCSLALNLMEGPRWYISEFRKSQTMR